MKIEEDTVWSAIVARAWERPDAVAIRSADTVVSYGSFCDRVERLASGMREIGIACEDRVLVLAPNRPETCVVWLACHRLGAAACLASPKATEREVIHALNTLEPRAVVGDPPVLELAEAALRVGGPLQEPLWVDFRRDGDRSAIADLLESEPIAIQDPSADAVAEVLFTSGTTSAPKAVEAGGGRLLRHWEPVSRQYGMGWGDVAYMVTPIHHQSGLRHVGLISWIAGAEVFIADGFHPRTLWDEVRRHDVTYSCMLDAMFQILVSLPESGFDRDHSLRLVVGVGDPHLGEECERRYGFEIAEVYGSTETGAPVSARLGMSEAEHSRYRHAIPGARFCGWPIAPNQVRIAPFAGQDPDPDGIGEIVVSSTVAANRYLHGPAYADPEADRDGEFPSGDRGVIGPDGAVYFVGRSQDLIRRAGENISALEIEAVLNEHPEIVQAAVVGVPDRLREEEVKAYVVPRHKDLDPAALRGWLEGHLSSFKLPRYIDVCPVLPLTESGKINKGRFANEAPVAVTSFDAAASERHSLPGR